MKNMMPISFHIKLHMPYLSASLTSQKMNAKQGQTGNHTHKHLTSHHKIYVAKHLPDSTCQEGIKPTCILMKIFHIKKKMLCCTPDLPSEEREREDEDDICLPFWFRLSREVFGTPVLKTCHIRYASTEKSIILLQTIVAFQWYFTVRKEKECIYNDLQFLIHPYKTQLSQNHPDSLMRNVL